MAYSTTQRYKEVIYSGDSKHRVRIWFNNVELENADIYCEKITRKPRIIPDDGAKRISLDNFVSQEIELILHNVDASIIKDQVRISIGTVVNSNSLGDIYEDVPIGIFNIQDEPVTDKDKITITLRDNAVLFDFGYNAKPLIDANDGVATKMQILKDICNQAGVICGVQEFANMNDELAIYDNTITGRTYVAYLAEQSGNIATINRSGELIFININRETGNASGNNIIIENAVAGKLINLQLNGDTEQETTTQGKNLFDINAIKENYALWGTGGGGNSTSTNTTDYIPVSANQTYTFSYDYTSLVATGYRSYEFYNSSKTFTSGGTYNSSNKSTTITSTQNGYIRISYDKNCTDIQLEKGSQATPYEPFTPNSPSPDYPSPIETVTGRQEISVNEDSYEINLGKNLFDGLLELGGYQNGVKDNRNERYRCANKIPVEPNTTYTFSINGVAQKYVYQMYGSDKTYLTETDTQTGTFTTLSNCYYITFRCFIADFTSDYANLKVQLEKGTQATTYSAYKTPIELCKIGDYQDYLYKQNNKWYKHKEIQKVNFTNTQNWILNTAFTSEYMATKTELGINLPQNSMQFISSHFKAYGVAPATLGTIRIGGSYVCANYDNGSGGVNNFKTWLGNNNVSLYYVLSTSIEEEITDEELIGQLNDLYDAELVDGINHIVVFSNNLPATLGLKYYKPKTAQKIPLSVVEKYEIGDKFEISRVVYEDAIRKFQYPNEIETSNDTLFINSANPFIDRQEQIDTIYELVNDIELDSLTTGKILGDPSIDPYDIIEIYGYYDENNQFVDDKETIVARTLGNHTSTYNGAIINEFDTQIGLEERKENVTLKGEASFRRFAKTNIDNINNNIEMLVVEQNEQNEQISQTIQTVSNIQNIFQVTGGTNLIKNSVGLFGENGELSYWDVQEGADVIFGEDNTLIGKTVSASKISICNTTIQTSINNITGLTLGTIKTLSYKIRQDEDTTTTIKLYGLSSNVPLYEKTFDEEMNWQEIFDEEQSKIFIDTPNLKLVIESVSTYDGRFEISDLMLNEGEKQSWSPANGEVWGEVVKLNQNGISVYSLQGKIATLMASQGFQVRELNSGELGNIITILTNMGLETKQIILSSKMIQKDMVHDVIDYEGHETYISYIRSGL